MLTIMAMMMMMMMVMVMVVITMMMVLMIVLMVVVAMMLDDVCVCVEAPACADAKQPGSSRFAKHLPWSPWSAAGHLSRVLSVLRDSVLRVVEGAKDEPQIEPAPPKRQR